MNYFNGSLNIEAPLSNYELDEGELDEEKDFDEFDE